MPVNIANLSISLPFYPDKEKAMRACRTAGWVSFLVAFVCLAAVGLVMAKTIEVVPGKASSISDVLTRAEPGDVVLLACGTFYESTLWMPSGVTLEGVGAPGCVVIQGDGSGQVFIVDNADETTAIVNLTVTVDYEGPVADPTHLGGGMLLSNSSPTLSNVIFSGLRGSYGGAVYCANESDPVFIDCTFENNTALATGGAIACVDSASVSLTGCLFVDNSSGGMGGAVNVSLTSSASLESCTLVGNSAAVGGAVASFDATAVTLTQVIVNEGKGGAVWNGDGAGLSVTCSDFFLNDGGDWTGILGPVLGTDGNIAADPDFCGLPRSENPYMLAQGSPCLDPLSACGTMGAYGEGCDNVSNVPGEKLPSVSRIDAAFPNPFNPRTSIKYDLHQTGHVELAVFDIKGRMVDRLVSEVKTAGSYAAVWEGRDCRGRNAAAGVYFFRLKTADTIDTKRVTLIK
jgi:predicted outer membrane repeat protein